MRSNGVVVGVDGSASGQAALRWATVEAARRQAELFVVHGYDWGIVGPPGPVGGAYTDEIGRAAQALVDTAVEQVRRQHPLVHVKGEAVFGGPAALLVEASADAALVVVGDRGRGGFAGLVLGSVSHQLASHAHGPVVVVRGRDVDGPVVVGVDGSDGSLVALGAALDEARLLDRDVVAVRVYEPFIPIRGTGAMSHVEDEEERRVAELALLESDVAPWREKFPDVTVTFVVTAGRAAEVLSSASTNAGLIVVGTHGHGELAGLMLGSVSLRVLQHAQCPVLVARAHSVV